MESAAEIVIPRTIRETPDSSRTNWSTTSSAPSGVVPSGRTSTVAVASARVKGELLAKSTTFSICWYRLALPERSYVVLQWRRRMT